MEPVVRQLFTVAQIDDKLVVSAGAHRGSGAPVPVKPPKKAT